MTYAACARPAPGRCRRPRPCRDRPARSATRSKRAEHEAAQFGDPQPLQIVLVLAEASGHAALAADAAPERDARQIAFEVVAPAVIDAGQPVSVVALRSGRPDCRDGRSD